MTGRVKHADVRDIFQGGDSSGYYIWAGDVGDEPLHGLGPGGFPERVSHRLTERHSRRLWDGSWEYPPLYV